MKYFKQYTLLQLLNCRGRVYSAYSLVIARSRATKQSRTYDEIAASLDRLGTRKDKDYCYDERSPCSVIARSKVTKQSRTYDEIAASLDKLGTRNDLNCMVGIVAQM